LDAKLNAMIQKRNRLFNARHSAQAWMDPSASRYPIALAGLVRYLASIRVLKTCVVDESLEEHGSRFPH
jgi:hypothetical protein